jgi:hypothetical protein
MRNEMHSNFDLFGLDAQSGASTPERKPSEKTTSTSVLKINTNGKTKLSPAQQRFNKLLSRVETLRVSLEGMELLADKFRPQHQQHMAQVQRETQEVQKKMLLFLHEKLQTKALTANQKRYATAIVEDLLQMLNAQHSAELSPLYAHYHSQASQEEALQEQEESLNDLKAELEAMMGRPIEGAEDINSHEEMMAHLFKLAQQEERERQARLESKRAKRRPTAKQQAAEQQAMDAKSAIRTIFRQLASALHPDRATDAKDRAEKTALMSQVNAAYERNDLNALLRLQLQAAQIDESSIARMADDKLNAMSHLLNAQVKSLEANTARSEMQLSHEFQIRVSANMSDQTWQALLKNEQSYASNELGDLASDLARVQSDAELKRWLKEQNALRKRQSDLDVDIADFEAFMHMRGW